MSGRIKALSLQFLGFLHLGQVAIALIAPWLPFILEALFIARRTSSQSGRERLMLNVLAQKSFGWCSARLLQRLACWAGESAASRTAVWRLACINGGRAPSRSCVRNFYIARSAALTLKANGAPEPDQGLSSEGPCAAVIVAESPCPAIALLQISLA